MPYADPQKQKEYMRNYAQKNRGKIREISKRYYKNKRAQGEGVSKGPVTKMCKKCRTNQLHDWMKDAGRNEGGKYKHVCQACIRKEKRKNWAKARYTGAAAFVRREKLKKKCIEYLGTKCQDCGLIDDCPVVYDFHHRDPKTKVCAIGKLLQRATFGQKLMTELDKCDLLCSNCHRRRHYKDTSAMTGRPPTQPD